MNKLICLGLFISMSVNAELPTWLVSDDLPGYAYTGAACVLAGGDVQRDRMVSNYTARANLVAKRNAQITATERLSISNDSESYSRTIVSKSEGFLHSVRVIEAGIYLDKSGSKYDCSWVGIK